PGQNATCTFACPRSTRLASRWLNAGLRMNPLVTVGRSVAPIYGVEKATGTLRFPADVNLTNMLWMKILRSPHAHAKILDVDAAAAQKLPGVVAILTHNDVPR